MLALAVAGSSSAVLFRRAELRRCLRDTSVISAKSPTEEVVRGLGRIGRAGSAAATSGVDPWRHAKALRYQSSIQESHRRSPDTLRHCRAHAAMPTPIESVRSRSSSCRSRTPMIVTAPGEGGCCDLTAPLAPRRSPRCIRGLSTGQASMTRPGRFSRRPFRADMRFSSRTGAAPAASRLPVTKASTVERIWHETLGLCVLASHSYLM